MGTIISHPIIRLIRVNQWVKNLFLFIPMFFAGELMALEKYPKLFLGFLTFCLASSFVYVLNDLKDIENDRKHPEKKSRPVAAGEVTISRARWLMAVFLTLVVFLCFLLPLKFGLVVFSYLALNVFYTYIGKNISILDVILVSIGFILRIRAGGIISVIALSKWIVVMVFLLSLFLAFAKRRDDLIFKSSTGLDLRKVAKNYTIEFLDTVLALLCGVIIVAYLMYCFSPEVVARMGYRIYYTVLFVVSGLLRYLQITIVFKDSGSPSRTLIKDRFLQLVLFGWIMSFYLLMYFENILVRIGI